MLYTNPLNFVFYTQGRWLLLIRALFGVVGFILTIPEDVETLSKSKIDIERLFTFATLCI